MTRVIEVIVSSAGETQIKTQGFTGSDCLQASKSLEHALGIQVNERKTAEYYNNASTEQQLPQQ